VNDFRLPAPTGPLVVPPLDKPSNLFFSLIVPTYKECENVQPLVEQVTQILDERYRGRYEIIFADDDSPDETGQVVAAISERFPQVKLMVRKNERDLSTAVVRGWQNASGEILGVMDGDLQHPVTIWREVLNKIEQGADLVVATRYEKKDGLGAWGPIRRIQSQSAALVSFLVLPEATASVTDPMSGCFALRRTAIAGQLLKPQGYKLLLEVLARGNASNVDEVPYVFQLRRFGKTKVNWKLYVEYLLQLISLRIFLWKRKLPNK
jgi:dolichol-phosphate mannosyltransferase